MPKKGRPGFPNRKDLPRGRQIKIDQDILEAFSKLPKPPEDEFEGSYTALDDD